MIVESDAMSEKGTFPCSDPVFPLDPEPPAAIDSLGIKCQGPVLAKIVGAKLPPPKFTTETQFTRCSIREPAENSFIFKAFSVLSVPQR
jgi:hypothetical protein